MEISDTVNPVHVAIYLFITLLHILPIFHNMRTLFSTTYISVVIDCIFNKKIDHRQEL
jgi:hypothetical protein